MSHSSQPNVSSGNPNELTFNIYGYNPSLGAAVTFLVLFGILSVVHTALVIRSRIWWFSVIIVGGVGELAGWTGRAIAAKNVYSLNAFLDQQVSLIIAPCFFSATIYGLLGMLIRKLGPEYSRLRPNLYLWIFCICDLIAIVVQAIGGAMSAIALKTSESAAKGSHIMVAGIVFQLFSMIVFCLLGLDFYTKAQKGPTYLNKNRAEKGRTNFFVFGLGFSSFWILVRCIYRTVELAEGWGGYLLSHQIYFLCLDSIPMVLSMGTFLISHPYFCFVEVGGTEKVNSSHHQDIEGGSAEDLPDSTGTTISEKKI